MRKLMPGVLSLLMAFSLATAAFAADPPAVEKYGSEVGQKMKPFKLSDPSLNKDFTLTDLAVGGKDVALVFMQSACSLCVAEVVDLVGAADDLEGKLNVALVSLDFDAKRIQPYKDAYKVPFTILHDKDGDTLAAANFNATPSTVVLDSKGIIKSRTSGYNKAELKSMIKAYSK